MTEKKTHHEKVIEGKAVSPAQIQLNNFFKKLRKDLQNFQRDENFKKIIGLVLLLLGLRWLRAWILGLLFIILGILLLVGYFDKN
ncbi:MAG: hypothetical protein GXP45_02680 [bacterium]|nr:hypothetical protein [bacterium]